MKSLACPALMGLLVLLLPVRGEAGRDLIVLGALPAATIAPRLAQRSQVYSPESGAAVLLTTVLGERTLGGVIALIS